MLTKKLKKESKKANNEVAIKAIQDQIGIENYLGRLWWQHNVRNLILPNKEYTEWAFGIFDRIPKHVRKEVEMKEFALIISSVVKDFGPVLKEEENK